MTTPHISARPGDFADTVLMPGDPLRARYIAENFLDTARLVTGVRNTITYFTAARPELPVRGAMLTGDGASLAGFTSALGEVLRLPIQRGNPFDALAVRDRDRDRTAADSTRAVVAVGLAMRSAA